MLIPKSYLYNKIADSVLSILLRSPHKKELDMKYVYFKHVSPEDYSHIIDICIKLDMKYMLDRIIFEHIQGSFETTSMEVASDILV